MNTFLSRSAQRLDLVDVNEAPFDEEATESDKTSTRDESAVEEAEKRCSSTLMTSARLAFLRRLSRLGVLSRCPMDVPRPFFLLSTVLSVAAADREVEFENLDAGSVGGTGKKVSGLLLSSACCDRVRERVLMSVR